MLKTIWIDDEPYQVETDELVELGRKFVDFDHYLCLFKSAGGTYLEADIREMGKDDQWETWRILSTEQAIRFMSPAHCTGLTEAGEKELASLLERFAVRL